MTIYYAIIMFIFGACFGSFYNVVGYRVPRGMSIVKPQSHCTTCNHSLNVLDLFPIISYIFLRGKCRYCKSKVNLFYPLFETITGLLFMICYLKYGFSYELIIALVFISMSLIIIISDYQTMIIPDSVLIISSILIIITDIFGIGLMKTGSAIINGLIAFALMYLLKLFGDLLFKKESMGGGDIKLMFIIGLVLGWGLGLINIFVASVIALPISCIILYKNADHVIPFGPFLALGSMILLLSKVDINWIINTIVLR